MALFGLDRAIEQLRAYRDGLYEGAAEAQIEVSKAVLGRAQGYVPVDTGALRQTGHVTEPIKKFPLRISISVEFGGPLADYAVYVHEDLSKFHLPPTQAKFLQRAVDEERPGMTLKIANGAVSAAQARSVLR